MPEEPDVAVVNLDDEIVETFFQRLAAKAALKGNYGFDPTILLAIISAIIMLFQQCQKPTAKRLKRRGLLVRAQLRSAFRSEFPDMRFRELNQAVDDVFDVAVDSTDEEVDRFVGACCR